MKYEFDRNYLEETIEVQPVVLQELRRLIEEDLDKCGIYYRLYSRVKSPASLEKKYKKKNYNDEKQIQDLIGFRINVYFQEDLDICQMIMAKRFVEVDWSEIKNSENEFHASKRNGVYRIPAYLVGRISKRTWELGIDQTFEIQFKTVLFEGWHEIEHDIRYKNQEIWSHHWKELRRLNSIIATLELCDNSITHIIEDMAHSLYKEHDWENMIRLHYRLKLSDHRLLPEFKKILDGDDSHKLGKALFKYDKEALVGNLLEYNCMVQLDVNALIAVINEKYLHNEEIAKAMIENDIQLTPVSKKSLGYQGVKHYPLIPNVIGHVKVSIARDSFREVCKIMQQWVVDRFGSVFEDLSSKVENGIYQNYGYSVKIHYNEETYSYELETSHMDQELSKTFWVTKGKVYKEENQIRLEVATIYYSCTLLSMQEKVMNFSIPGFYRTICKDIGVYDGKKVVAYDRACVEPEQLKSLNVLIEDSGRQLPVIVITVTDWENDEAQNISPEKGWVRALAWNVKNYAHVFVCRKNTLSLCDREGIYLYGIGDSDYREYYSWEEADSCTYEYDLGIGNYGMERDVITCRNAFEHMVEDKIKEWNIKGGYYDRREE